MSVAISNSDEGLETSALTGASLLLHGHDLEDLVLEGSLQEEVNNLRLLDGERVQVDMLKRLDLLVSYKTTKLGDGDPGLVLIVTSTSTAATASTTSTTVATVTSTTATAEASTASTTLTGWLSFRHC